MRRSGTVVLALGVAACASGPAVRTLSAPGWEGCQVVEMPGTVRAVRCGGVDLRVMRAPTLGNEAGVRAMAERAATDGDDGEPEVIRAGDRDVPARIGEDWLVAAPRPDVLAYCRERHPALAGCRAAIAAIGRTGLPPGVAFPEPRLVLLDRALVVPEGCVLAGGERIACPATGFALDWREQPATGSAEALLDTAVKLLRSRFESVEEKRAPCVLVGRPGSGAAYAVRTKSGTASAFACVVVQNGVTSMAQCQGPLRSLAPFPPPCDQVLERP